MNDDTIKVVTAIGALTVLEVVALLNGINGTLFSTVTMVIGGLAGYGIASKRAQS